MSFFFLSRKEYGCRTALRSQSSKDSPFDVSPAHYCTATWESTETTATWKKVYIWDLVIPFLSFFSSSSFRRPRGRQRRAGWGFTLVSFLFLPFWCFSCSRPGWTRWNIFFQSKRKKSSRVFSFRLLSNLVGFLFLSYIRACGIAFVFFARAVVYCQIKRKREKG